MLGIEALRLDVAYAAIGKHLGLPTQSYMALSDAKTLDAQAGAETFGSARWPDWPALIRSRGRACSTMCLPSACPSWSSTTKSAGK